MTDASHVTGPAGSPPRRQQLVELGVFLFLVVPSMFLSLATAQPKELSFSLVAGSSLLTDLALLSLVLYFVWSSGEGVRAVGWVPRGLVREMAVGAGLFVPFFFGVSVVADLLQHAGLKVPSSLPEFLMPQGGMQVALALVFLVVVAVAEETLFRGYLILRLSAVTGSETAAVVLSSILFGIGHGYEGSGGLVTVGLMGAVFAMIYLWRRSLVAPMTMHFLQDFVSIMLVPLMAHGGGGH
ncbi:MAG TPA: type II CAAX endopeptidase family protein [Gammaproteobacteria bacterium]|nr:type II CAAX endopeptidase family protein [Gammaproteobacteria bacterium]